MRFITLDFETFEIGSRPHSFPPKPVGFSLKMPGGLSRYYAWGHPSGNNCTYEHAREVLRSALSRRLPVVCHNAPFDMAVLHEGMGLPVPEEVHDTLILAKLLYPYDRTHSLKPLSEKYLGLPPEEQDAVYAWLREHKVVPASRKDYGAFIAKAPGDLVGRYAIGDTDRTALLFEKLYLKVCQDAYQREMELQPVLYLNEREGVRVDHEALSRDAEAYQGAMVSVEGWLREKFNAPDLNFNADQQVADALEPFVTGFASTATGKRSVSKATLTKDKFTDPQVFGALGYRNRLQTCLSTFILPWRDMSTGTGRIHTSWRQMGAQTGRMSSSPNFQNMPKRWEKDGYAHPDFIEGLPSLPLLRRYILPEEGHVLIAADYNAQEVRVAAHFEDGPLAEAYNNPNPPAEWCDKNGEFDVHAFTARTIKETTGRDYGRDLCKIALFSTLYGSGAKGLGEQMGITTDAAAALRTSLMGALPGIKELDDELKQMAKLNMPFYTAGGREYYCEPRNEKGQSFDYKMLNTLIQGSSADQTKAALILYDRERSAGSMRLAVHDEIVISAPREMSVDEAKILVRSMESALKLKVPVIAKVKMGENFSEMK